MEQESHLSGAYIRSLVKQLSSSRTKHSMTPQPQNLDCVDSYSRHVKIVDAHPPKQPQQHHKKQVRRRLHTSKPYQERLLNMAEARREIVTALKFHRASMKQANQQPQKHPSSLSLHPEKDARFKSKSYMHDFSYSSSFSHPLPNSHTSSPAPPPPLIPQNPNFMLPNQTLGLNLNVHDFNNINATLYLHNINNAASSYSNYSSPSSSSSQELPLAAEEGNPSVMVDGVDSSAAAQVSGGLEDERMAEMRSLGEQYQMEWNDTMNLLTSAWWFKFFKHMEHGPTDDNINDAYQIFEEIIEFPASLNANESCFQHYCSQDYPTLPW